MKPCIIEQYLYLSCVFAFLKILENDYSLHCVAASCKLPSVQRHTKFRLVHKFAQNQLKCSTRGKYRAVRLLDKADFGVGYNLKVTAFTRNEKQNNSVTNYCLILHIIQLRVLATLLIGKISFIASKDHEIQKIPQKKTLLRKISLKDATVI